MAKKNIKTKKNDIREEALMYLREVINANRAIKDWMFRNTYYGVLAQFGIYVVFKDSAYQIDLFYGVFLICMAWFLAIYILKTNMDSIERLREKERTLIENTPLPWIRENWAGGRAQTGPVNRFFNIYVIIILLTGLILMLSMIKNNAKFKAALTSGSLPKETILPATQKPQ